jgi:putative phosphoesterase
MVLVALSDTHGNAAALEAVLAAVDEEGIQTILHAGDTVAGHGGNASAVALFQERGIPNVQGESDRKVVRFLRKRVTLERKCAPETFLALEQASQDCSSSQLEYLRGLPRVWQAEIDGIPMAMCSGSVTSASDILRGDDDTARFQRQREIIPAQILILGGSHEPFEKRVGDTLMVSPGTVGMGDDGLAHFAVISTESEPWQVDFRSVSY